MQSIEQDIFRLSGTANNSGFVALQVLLRLHPQIQLEFTIDPVNAFKFRALALHIAQIHRHEPKFKLCLF